MMKFAALACVAAFVSCVSAATPWHMLSDSYSFEQYKREFNKVYASPEEHATRKAHFQANLEAAMKHNALNKSWKEGVNHLSDRSPEEFQGMLGYNKNWGYSRTGSRQPTNLDLSMLEDIPKEVDWRKTGAVSAVKDQGQCGSCWTFAASATLESQVFLKTGSMASLSEQQIASCTSNPKDCGGTGGCAGGTAEVAYETLMNDGISSEWVYPYVSHGGKNFGCDTSAAKTPVNVTGYVKLPSNEAGPLMAAVAEQGPIAISVDASTWSRYETGVFDGCDATNPDIDHAVQLVGYGTDPQFGDYWLVRNSWTAWYGENGYIRVKRGDPSTPTCGVDKTPADGSGCTGGPSTVTVCGTCGILYDTCYPTIA